jgi:hypothetical protein
VTRFLKGRWGRLVHEETGQALVIAIAIVVIGMLLALGAAAYALNSGKASSHDEHTRGAQQAADTAVQASLAAQAGTAAVGYGNVTSTSLGSLLACIVPQINLSTGLQIGTTSIGVNLANGGCPSAVDTTGKNITNPWLSLSNGNYYESAVFQNAQPQAGSVGASAFSVQFPEIVGLGCNTTASSGASDCATNASGNARYARDLTLLAPTAPLQAIEAGNNVYLNSATGLNVTQCLQLLLGLNVVGALNCLLGGPPVMVLNGTVAAGNDVQVPSVLLGVNVNLSLASLLTSVFSLNLGNAISGLLGTIDYGNAYNETSVTPAAGTTGSGSYATSGTPFATVANIVHASGGQCTAGQPSTNCTLARPTFTLSSSQALTGTAGMSGTGYVSPTTGTSAGDLTMSSGTLNLAAGTYVFCNVNITGNATVNGPSSGAAQIFVLQPGAPQCPTPSANNQGNFSVASGINTSSVQGIVNGLTGVVNPSTVQIYVAGNPSDALVVGKATAVPTTNVSLGANGSALTQAVVIYAPRSNVSVNTTAAFVGSAIGWNVSLQALAVVQDLNLGGFPFASVVNGIKVNQNVECSNSVTQLAPVTSSTAQTSDTAGCT